MQEKSLLSKSKSTIHNLASFIGLIVFAGVAVPQAPIKYKCLKNIRNMALFHSKGDYNAIISLDNHARELIEWWMINIGSQKKAIKATQPDDEVNTDASLTGWGARLGAAVTGGHWDFMELDHINCLELKAVLLGLKSLCKDFKDTHIRLRSDNMTTIACIDWCGSTKISLLNIVEQIFVWANMRNITISAEYVRGCANIEADKASRIKNIDLEWMLNQNVFKKLCKTFTPDLDLFATRINSQLLKYVFGNQILMHGTQMHLLFLGQKA